MKRRAFTLIELLLAMAVTSLLIVLLANLADTVSRAYRTGESQAETGASARGVLNLLGRELQGAVIDLDFGFRIDAVQGEENNYVLKFLARREPELDASATAGVTPAVEKVAYQLGWAEDKLLPRIMPDFDPKHPIPVLVRSSSSDLRDVFVVSKAGEVASWTNTWGNLPAEGVVSGVVDGTTIEVAAENVLGWQVVPYFWDATAQRIRSAKRDDAVYYNTYLLSNAAPRALQVSMVVAPSKSVARMAGSFADSFANVRQQPNLFKPADLPTDPYSDLLRQVTRTFDSTFYLSSKSP